MKHIVRSNYHPFTCLNSQFVSENKFTEFVYGSPYTAAWEDVGTLRRDLYRWLEYVLEGIYEKN